MPDAWLSGLRKAAGFFCDLLLPRVCAACGVGDVAGDYVCADCSARLLAVIARSYCHRCAVSTAGPTGDSCPLCPTVLPRYARVVRLGSYEPPLSHLVRQFKYRRHEGLRRHMGGLLAQAVQARCDEPFDLVLAIPAHWRRRFQRSYDHSRLLAASVARGLDLPLGDELVRVRDTPPQAHLPKTRRIENIRGAFAVTDPRSIAGARILLVDDVTTTGATANEAARMLLDHDATAVVLAAIAKADPPKAFTHQ